MTSNLKRHWHRSTDYIHVPLASSVPSELLFLSPILNQNDAMGTEDCTAFSGVACRYNETNNTTFDPMKQWQSELDFMGVKASNGTDLRTTLAVGVKTGFYRIGNTAPTDNASAYFFVVPTNGLDMFDSIIYALNNIQRPLQAGVMWKYEWNAPEQGIITTAGTNNFGGHCIKIAGHKTINEVQYIVVQNSWGQGFGDNGLFYFPREVVNQCFGSYGVGYWSDDVNPQIKTLGYIQSLYQNIVSLLQTLLS